MFFIEYKYVFIEYKNTFLLQISNHSLRIVNLFEIIFDLSCFLYKYVTSSESLFSSFDNLKRLTK